MTTQQLLNLSMRELNKLTDKQLRSALSTVRSTARKRYERLIEQEQYSPATRYIVKSGRGDTLFPTVRGMDRTRMINEFGRYKHFLELRTSTVTGAKEVKDDLRKNVYEITGQMLDDGDLLAVWEITGELENGEYGGIFNYKDMLNVVGEIVSENPDLSDFQIQEYAKQRLQEIYEQEQATSTIYPSAFMQ